MCGFIANIAADGVQNLYIDGLVQHCSNSSTLAIEL